MMEGSENRRCLLFRKPVIVLSSNRNVRGEQVIFWKRIRIGQVFFLRGDQHSSRGHSLHLHNSDGRRYCCFGDLQLFQLFLAYIVKLVT